jgi:hypothetical protein
MTHTAISCAYGRISPSRFANYDRWSKIRLAVWVPHYAIIDQHRWGYAELPARPEDLGTEWRDSTELGNADEWFHYRDPRSRRLEQIGGTIFDVEFENEHQHRHRACRHLVEYHFDQPVPNDPRGLEVGAYHSAGAAALPLELKILAPNTVPGNRRQVMVKLDGETEWRQLHYGSAGVTFHNAVPEWEWTNERAANNVWKVSLTEEALGSRGFEALFMMEGNLPHPARDEQDKPFG